MPGERLQVIDDGEPSRELVRFLLVVRRHIAADATNATDATDAIDAPLTQAPDRVVRALGPPPLEGTRSSPPVAAHRAHFAGGRP